MKRDILLLEHLNVMKTNPSSLLHTYNAYAYMDITTTDGYKENRITK